MDFGLIPKELLFIFLSGFCLFLTKNWVSLNEKEKFTGIYVFKESAIYGFVVYLFFVFILSLNQVPFPLQHFVSQLHDSASLLTLAAGVSGLLLFWAVEYFASIKHHFSKLDKLFSKNFKTVLFLILFAVIYFLVYGVSVVSFTHIIVMLTFLVGIIFLVKHLFAKEILDEHNLVLYFIVLLVVLSVLFSLAFTQRV